MLRRFGVAALVLALAGCTAAENNAPAAVVEAEQTAEVAAGRELVEGYCASCHNIETVGDSPHAEAPPFRTLHERYDVEWLSEGLVEGLVSGHPDMPEFEFDPQQAAAIVAFLRSLTPESAQ